jgi:outer membrane protein TolC
LSAPEAITTYTVDKEKALEFARKHRSQTEQFRLNMVRAERQVELAQKNNGPNLQLSGSFGLTKSSDELRGAYNNLLDQERVSLSINIPIADFGRTKAQREIAKSNLERTKLQVRQNEVSFEREIMVNVEQFELKRSQLQLSEEALEIALKRLDIAKKRFQIGKIDVTNLNIAIQEEQNARQQYFNNLWDLWRAHYTIRNLTLYDFETNTPLE